MGRISAIGRLSEVDQELDEKAKRARQVDERLASDPALVAAHTALQGEEKQLGDLKAKLRSRELEAQSLDANIKQIAERLYSGRVSNPKELEGIEQDLEMHKRQRSQIDDRLLELMDAVDQAQKRVAEKNAVVKRLETTRANEVEQLNHERESLTTRLTGLAEARDQIRAGLDAEILRTYDHLRRTKGGHAVALLRRDSCGTCGVAVPTGLISRVKVGDEMVLCSGCGRLLTN